MKQHVDDRRTTQNLDSEALLEVAGLSHEYLPGKPTLGDVTFRINDGEFVSIVGPSGCGKTTLLKAISGLMSFTGGSVRFESEEVDGVPAEMAMVFQDYSRSLMPWLRVAKNVELPLRYLGLSASERRGRVESSLAAVGLSDAGNFYPWQMSGGMQQRAAIARALAYGPRILLMDEPFASVDAQTRSELEDLVAQLHRESGVTIMLVTHDIDEAVYLADRVLVLSKTPTRVVEEVVVSLPSPRDQIESRKSAEFVNLRSHVAELIRKSATADTANGNGNA